MLAVIDADPRRSRLGLRSRIAERIGGSTLLERTARRLRAAPGIDGLVIACPPGGESEVRAALGDGPAEVIAIDAPDPRDHLSHLRRRRWSLASWSGGPAGGLFAAESQRPARLAAVARAKGLHEVLVAPDAAPWIDPGLVGEIVSRFVSGTRVLLSTAPPGLAADAYAADVLEGLAGAGHGLAETVRFRPDAPDRDPARMGLFHWFPERITRVRVRLTADGDGGLERARALADRLEDGAGAEAVIAALESDLALVAGGFPGEVIADITARTARRGSVRAAPPAGTDMSRDRFAGLIRQIGRRDDVRLTLGDRGEPLLHPEIDAFLEILSGARPFGLHIHTDAIDLGEETLRRIAALAPEFISVGIDAVRRETYAALHGVDALETVERNVERLIETGAAAVVPEFWECPKNEAEREAFFDRWWPRTSAIVVRDPREGAGETRTAGRRHAPPWRRACIRIQEQLVVRGEGPLEACVCADGRASLSLSGSDMAEAWTGERLRALRDAHARGEWPEPCAACAEWCRL
ncbi:MAG: hypothetical protein JXP34_27965 [Planctomycetes bacterium]|nr:hypothetical protein [Planctomycetota bacterium]